MSANDIALLRLGKTNSYNLRHHFLPEDQVDLLLFGPACLPSNSSSFVGQEGLVYGEQNSNKCNWKFLDKVSRANL